MGCRLKMNFGKMSVLSHPIQNWPLLAKPPHNSSLESNSRVKFALSNMEKVGALILRIHSEGEVAGIFCNSSTHS